MNFIQTLIKFHFQSQITWTMWKETHETNFISEPHSFICRHGLILIENYILHTLFFLVPVSSPTPHIFLRYNPFYYEPVAFFRMFQWKMKTKKWSYAEEYIFWYVVCIHEVVAELWSKEQIVYNSIVMHLLYRVIKILAICTILKYDPCNELPMHLMYDHRCKCKCSLAKYREKFSPNT